METYDKIAFFYDYLMTHVNYPYWVNYIIKLLKHHGCYFENMNVLDCSCGTALFLEYWRKKNKGFVLGSDLSFLMLKEGKKHGVGLVRADMRKLPFRNKLDLALSLFDSVNYLMTTDCFRDFLLNAYFCLKPGGILIFDITTAYSSELYFHDAVYYDRYRDIPFEHRVYYDSSEKIQHNDFRYEWKNEMISEKHEQKIYSVEEVVDFIKLTEFEVLGLYKNFKLLTADDKSERVHFVLRK